MNRRGSDVTVVVPYSPIDPKTRLAPVLDPVERQTFAELLLDDVLSVLETALVDPVVLSPEPVSVGVPVCVDKRSLSVAVNGVLNSTTDPVAIVMADLGLLTPATLKRLLSATADLVIAPGRGGGTNALVVDHPEFFVDYHGGSYRDHLEIADAIGATVCETDSYRLATDMDEPADLAELLLHGSGMAAEYLVELGFELDEAFDHNFVRRAKSSITADE